MISSRFRGDNSDPRKILILEAIPKGSRFGREIRNISEAIKRSRYRDRFTIEIHTAVRPRDIRRAIIEKAPYIVHFCGHGTEQGCLVLEDDEGCPKLVTSDALASLFKLSQDSVQCVLLNACFSDKPAAHISQYIDYTIGMNREVADEAAIAFSEGFYDALGEYEDSLSHIALFRKAFDVGLNAIELEGFEGQNPIFRSKHSRVEIRRIEIGSNLPNHSNGPLPPPSPPPPSSKVIGRYSELRKFLQMEQWKEADTETTRMLLEITGRQKAGWLRVEDIKPSLCSDLRVIDNLWQFFSQNRFGFSIQRDVWLSVGGQRGQFNADIFLKFGNHVGWSVDNEWLCYGDLFTVDAVDGHFPSFRITETVDRSDWLSLLKDNFKSFLPVIEQCLISKFQRLGY